MELSQERLRDRAKPLSKEEVDMIKSKDVHDVIKRVMIGDGLPFVVDLELSEGVHITDKKTGKKYLDMFGFFSSNTLGLKHKMIDEEFMNKIKMLGCIKPTSETYTEELAKFIATFERVCMFPNFKYCFFIEGGALAVENAIKASIDYKVRKNLKNGKGKRGKEVMHFKNAFHGRSGYTMSLTNTVSKFKVMYFPKFKWPRIEVPFTKFPQEGSNMESTIKQEKLALEQIDKVIAEKGDDIACMIIEPIQSEGGDNHFRKEFLQKLREVTAKNDIMLIFDEIQTGFGTTGALWAFQHFDIVPDMICFGKKTHVCGFMSTSKIDEVENHVFSYSSRIDSTFGGNFLDMIRFRKILEILESEKLVENSKVVGEFLLSKLHEIEKESEGLISNVRGRGLYAAFDLSNSEQRNEFVKMLMKNGLICLCCGEKTTRFRPSLVFSKENVMEAFEIIKATVSEYNKKLKN